MRYYPVNLDIHRKNCLVVGGGSVGARKVRTLLDCGARVTLVSPEICQALVAMSAHPDLQIKKRAYRSSDLDGMFLVIGATDDEALNRQISQDAEQRHTLCNIADRPAACNFILPSIVRRGDLIIAISTSGSSPAFAKKLRQDLENQFGAEYAVFIELMGAIRRQLLKQIHAPEAHKPIFNQLIQSQLIDRIREQNETAIDSILQEILGAGLTYRSLMSS